MESRLPKYASEHGGVEEWIPYEEKNEPAAIKQDQGKSVLVVDDLAELREMMVMILTLLGYRVATASSGEEAVEYLKTNRADILILDMIMDPGMDGLETFRQIRKMNPEQKAILISGFADRERVKEAMEMGIGAFMQKPCTVEKIGAAIRRELERSSV
jgi:DNA-binding NtrC family response regulator